MATEKEKAKVRELVELALDINGEGRVHCVVEVKGYGIDMRVAPIPFHNEWIYYSDDVAYFKKEPFTEERFLQTIEGYIHEAKKHHPAFDADGVKL